MTDRSPVAAGAIAGLMFLVAGCSEPPPAEQQIRTSLDNMTAALEGGDIGDFMDPVAEDFIAGNGGLDRRALGLLVRRERLARSAIRVRRMATEIEQVGEDRAKASFRALATGGSGWLPDEGRLWTVSTGWRREGARWMLISADWSPVIGQ